MKERHLLFSKRKRLGELFDLWRESVSGARPSDCAMNVIAWLDSNGLVNRRAVEVFLQREAKLHNHGVFSDSEDAT